MTTKRQIAVALAVGLLLPSATNFGAAADPVAQTCWDQAQSQTDLALCAGADARAADEKLNAAFARLKCFLDPEQKAKLVAAQRAWIAFRDADCAFWRGEGTIAAMNAASCAAARSFERASELDSWPPNAPRSALIAHTPCP